MNDIDNLIERLRDAPPHQTLCQVARQLKERCAEAADALEAGALDRAELAEILRLVTAELDAYRKATGGISIERLTEMWEAPHRIQFRDDGWMIEHPLRERLEGTLWQCRLNWDGDDPGLRGIYDLGDNGKVVLPPATFEECATDWNSCGGCATYQHDISYHDAATFEEPT